MSTSTTEGGAAVRSRRRALLRELIARHRVASQSELVALLADRGIDATQATVSRDLDELRIGKQRGADGRVAYALPEPAGLAQVLRQFALSFGASGNLAVIRTPPGLASAVAAAVDEAREPGVLATVQGDDTVLVVAAEGSTGREIAGRLESMAAAPALAIAAEEHAPYDRLEHS